MLANRLTPAIKTKHYIIAVTINQVEVTFHYTHSLLATSVWDLIKLNIWLHAINNDVNYCNCNCYWAVTIMQKAKPIFAPCYFITVIYIFVDYVGNWCMQNHHIHYWDVLRSVTDWIVWVHLDANRHAVLCFLFTIP